MKSWSSFRLAAVALFCLVATVSSTTILVPADQPTIQAGIDAAVNGDTVLVAPGTYTGDGNFNIDYHGNGIAVVGDSTAGGVVLRLAPVQRAFFFHSGEDSTAVLSGFTVIADYEKALAMGRGAILCDSSSSPIIRFCRFLEVENLSCGTAIAILGGSHPVVSYSEFRNNSSISSGVTGAVGCENAAVTIRDCVFEGNRGKHGGAIAAFNGSIDARGCTFIRNKAQQWVFESDAGGDGGAAYLRYSQGNFQNCLFLENEAPLGWNSTFDPEGGTGGAVAVRSSDCVFRNCTFVGNTTSPFTGERAGAFYADSSTVTVENCIVAYNNSFSTTFVNGNGQSVFTLTSTDVYGNIGGDWVGAATGQVGVRGNMSADPSFCDTATEQFNLAFDSPCWITSGPAPFVMGAYPVGCCVCQKVGNVDCDLQGLVDVTDLTVLIDNLFISPALPCCDTQADIDGEPSIDIADISALIDNLYITFTPLRECY